MSSLEGAVRDCLARAAATVPVRAVDRAEGAIRRARRVRRRQSASGVVAVVVVTVLAGGAVAWHAPGQRQQRGPAEIAVEGAPFLVDACGRALRCAD